MFFFDTNLLIFQSVQTFVAPRCRHLEFWFHFLFLESIRYIPDFEWFLNDRNLNKVAFVVLRILNNQQKLNIRYYTV